VCMRALVRVWTCMCEAACGIGAALKVVRLPAHVSENCHLKDENV